MKIKILNKNCGTEIPPYTQGCFVPSLVEIGPLFLGKNMKVLKVYWQMDRGWTTGDEKKQLIWIYIHNQSMSDMSFLLTWSWVRPGYKSNSFN